MNNTWATDDTTLAAFAMVTGDLELVSVGPGASQRYIYTFHDPKDTGSTVLRRYLNHHQVSAIKFSDTRRFLLRALREAQHKENA